MKRSILNVLLLALGLAMAAAAAKGGVAESHVGRVAFAMNPAAMPAAPLLADVDTGLDNANVGHDEALTPARGCKACFG